MGTTRPANFGNATDNNTVCYHFNQNHFDNGQFPMLFMINAALNVAFSIMAAVGNSLILSVIWKVSTIRFPSKVLLANLAVTDMLVGSFVQPLYAVYQFAKSERLRYLFCTAGVLFYVSSSCLGAVSLLTVALISLDRYIAFYCHINYSSIVSKKRMGLALAIIWGTSIFLGTTWIWQGILFKIGSVTIIFLFIPMTTTAYYKIYKGLRLHQQRLHASESATQTEQSLNMARYKKSISNTIGVYCVLLLCYLPYLCTETFKIVEGQSVYNQRALEVHLQSSSSIPRSIRSCTVGVCA